MDVSVPGNAFVIPAGMNTITPEDMNQMLEKLADGKVKPAKKGKKKK